MENKTNDSQLELTIGQEVPIEEIHQLYPSCLYIRDIEIRANKAEDTIIAVQKSGHGKYIIKGKRYINSIDEIFKVSNET